MSDGAVCAAIYTESGTQAQECRLTLTPSAYS